MNKTLLINRINPQDFTKQKKHIFFLIGDIDKPTTEIRLVDVLSKYSLIDKTDILYKYNGVDLFITVQLIPEIIKLLSQENFMIYSVFETYNPEL